MLFHLIYITFAPSYDAKNRIMTDMKKKTLCLAACLAIAGMLHAQTGKTTYEYDKLNRLVRVVSPAGVTTYTYDVLGNRTAKTFTPSVAKPSQTSARQAAPADSSATASQQPSAAGSRQATAGQPLAAKEQDVEPQKP